MKFFRKILQKKHSNKIDRPRHISMGFSLEFCKRINNRNNNTNEIEYTANLPSSKA